MPMLWVYGHNKYFNSVNAMQCNAMQYNAMQCNAMQCNAMQCNAMQCNAMQCNKYISVYFIIILSELEAIIKPFSAKNGYGIY